MFRTLHNCVTKHGTKNINIMSSNIFPCLRERDAAWRALYTLNGIQNTHIFLSWFVSRQGQDILFLPQHQGHHFGCLNLQYNTKSPLTSNFLKMHFNISLPLTPGSSKWSLSLRFPPTKPVKTSLLPIRATCLAHPILLDFITTTIFRAAQIITVVII